MNLCDEFLAASQAHPDKPALVLWRADGHRSVSAGSLRQQVLACASFLHAQGLRAGASVVLRAPDALEDMTLLLALTVLGVGSYVPARVTEAERRVVQALGLQQVVTTMAEDGAFGLRTIKVDASAFSLAGASPAATTDLLADEGANPWLLRSSSGTTGTPKVFVTSHAQVISRCRRYRQAWPIGPGDLFCSLTPVRFGAARQRVLHALNAGATVLLLAEATLPQLLQGINASGVSHLYAVPMHLEQLCDMAAESQAGAPGGLLLPTLKSLEAESATVTPKLREKVHARLSQQLHVTYGVSEVGPLTSTACSTAREDELNSVGRPLPGVELAIFDANLQPVAPGVSGAIGVRLAGAAGELRTLQDDGSWRLGTRDGWFFPGDVGFVSSHGNLIFQGRNDDLMIFNGINIFPAEIEAAARAHAGVKDAAAFALRSRINQDIPCVALVLAYTLTTPTTPDFMAHFQQHLGARSPRLIFILPALPRNDMGKVLMGELRQRAAEQLAARQALKA